ncbi:MAG: domain of cyanobacterial aminoacyl-tRNA synthetase, partial [Cyanobacteriota bacterium]
LPLALLRHLLDQVSQLKLSQLTDLLPALRILALALAAGLVLKLTGAVLGSLNELPLLGGLLELVGLIRMVQLLSRHALKQQKRAELLGRIQALKRELLG